MIKGLNLVQGGKCAKHRNIIAVVNNKFAVNREKGGRVGGKSKEKVGVVVAVVVVFVGGRKGGRVTTAFSRKRENDGRNKHLVELYLALSSCRLQILEDKNNDHRRGCMVRNENMGTRQGDS